MNMLLKKGTILFLGLMAFHMGISVLMSWVVRMPYFLSHNAGLGLWRFAGDSIGYHEYAIKILGFLKEGDYVHWWTDSVCWHVKLISLSYGMIAPHPLSFAPINAAAWAMSVLLVFGITRQLFHDRLRLAIVSCLAFGFCPSYLLNTTQLLKEPFYVMGIIMVIWGWVGLLSGRESYKCCLSVGLGSLLACLTRGFILVPLVFLSLLAMLFVVWRTGQLWKHALLASVFVVGIYVIEHQTDMEFYRPGAIELGDIYASRILAARQQKSQSEKEKNFLWQGRKGGYFGLCRWLEYPSIMISYARGSFAHTYLNAGTNIDTEVNFRSVGDIVFYIPRALQVGFLAPFPNQWFGKGKAAGRIGRIIGGLETIGWYILLPGFLYFLGTGTVALQIRVWLALYCISMVLLAALVVTNIGALMRMRFVYLLPVLIGGLQGWSRFIWRKKCFA